MTDADQRQKAPPMATEHERYVASRYPGQGRRIGDLCESDPRFEDLCRRYREIARRLLLLEAARTPYVEAESHGLREERAAIEADLSLRLEPVAAGHRNL